LAAVQKHGNALQYAGDGLRRQLVELAHPLQYLGRNLSQESQEKVEKVAFWLSRTVAISVESVEQVSTGSLLVLVSTMGGTLYTICVQADATTEALRKPLAAAMGESLADAEATPFYSFSFLLPSGSTGRYGDDVQINPMTNGACRP